MKPQTPEEKVVWIAIVWTYGFYLLGALYPLAPAVAWLLVLSALRGKLPLAGALGVGQWRLPAAVWIWIVAMALMLVALVAGHIDFALGTAQTIKSSIGWAKGWALLALFLLIGGLRIRPELLARAACLLGAQTLVVLPITILAFLVGAPANLYVSPLQAIGGPGPEFFDVTLYGINPDNGLPRWRLFTPWGPALGFVGCIYFMLSLMERELVWRALGMAGAIAMILASGSRLGLLAIPVALGIAWVLPRLANPRILIGSAAVCLLAGFTGPQLLELSDTVTERFHAARPESSRVRATLGRIAVDRWADEAPVWGHGVVERGPHLVEYMPIGSHHSWYGLLFVKGVVGLVALAGAMAATLVALLRRGGPLADAGLRVLSLLFLYSFGENLEILSYLYWPGIVVLGAALFLPPAHNALGMPARSAT